MECLELPFACLTPAELLALDEVALDFTERTGRELFWTWEAATPWVVVGLGQSVSREVNLDACKAENIPVFRRCSGGGTVIQGPGCLNYAVTLRVDRDPELASITGTNRWIMNRQREALEPVVDRPIKVSGHTDLALEAAAGQRKFSGNAQRRRRTSLLFHGTILNSFDLSLLERFLPHPSAEPEYRAGRRHSEFVTNLAVEPAAIEVALRAAWGALSPTDAIPVPAVADLAAARYARPDWIFRR